MKYTAFYAVFYTLRQGGHILYGQPGELSVLAITVYGVILLWVWSVPFKTELKVLLALLFLLDSIAPIGGLPVRWIALIISVMWLCAYLWRRFGGTRDAVTHPWRE